jgi:hypothetical protein
MSKVGITCFMSLATGRRIIHNQWTELPMPKEAITRVSQLGRQQKMPKILTFANQFGFELPDVDNDVDDDHDSDYDPVNDTQSSDNLTALSDSSTHTSDDDDDDNNDTSGPGLIAGVDSDDEDSDDNEDEEDDNDGDSDPQEPEANIETEYKNGDVTTRTMK